jgi:hypothetical protein
MKTWSKLKPGVKDLVREFSNQRPLDALEPLNGNQLEVIGYQTGLLFLE